MSALRGCRVVITRAASQADPLARRLVRFGAVPVLFPAIETRPPESTAALDDALRRAAQYDWVVFTSATGVECAFARAAQLWTAAAEPDMSAGLINASWLARCRVAAVGPATAEALAERGVPDVAVPDEFAGEHIPAVLGGAGGLRILLLRADRAGSALPDRLRELGAVVDDVVAYRTVPLDSRVTGASADAVRAGIDAVTFTSPSTVEGFVNGLGEDWRAVVGDAVVVTIGPVTSEAARAAGMRVAAQAEPHTIDGLVDALVQSFEPGTGGVPDETR